MNIRLFTVLLILPLAFCAHAGITLRFEGRNLCEKSIIAKWLAEHTYSDFIVAAVGLSFIDNEAIKEGLSINIPGTYQSHDPSSVLTIDNFHGQFSIRDKRLYVIRLKESAPAGEKHLKNFAKKNCAENTLFCVQEIAS